MLHRVLQLRTSLRTASIGATRNLIAAQIARAGIALDDDRAYALRVAASELLDNAIKYGCDEPAEGRVELTIDGELDRHRRRLRITVTDPGVTVPKMIGRDDPDATGGRGLVVVAGYADEFGWSQHLDDGGRAIGWSVWFELDVQEMPPVFGQATAEAEVQPEDPVSALPRLHTLKTFAFTRRRQLALGRPFRRGRERRAA
ncbi:ATP-binding protein [Kitasatospora aureofaciens]|uniref:ATP-binding protein n=1 Tax=Kitasatospora aureofaciens TaxID=1894 RepID=UPI0037CCBF46